MKKNVAYNYYLCDFFLIPISCLQWIVAFVCKKFCLISFIPCPDLNIVLIASFIKMYLFNIFLLVLSIHDSLSVRPLEKPKNWSQLSRNEESNEKKTIQRNTWIYFLQWDINEASLEIERNTQTCPQNIKERVTV